MTEILVTGGTGVLGRQIVSRLAGRADVRVLSRRGTTVEGAPTIRGDLETGEGLPEAVQGAHVIVHAASITMDLRHPDRDVAATRHLLDAIPGEVAGRLVDLALASPAGRVADMGGPRVERAEDLMRAYLTATHRRRPIVRMPVPGRTIAAYRAGRHLAPDHATGVRDFAAYLTDHVDPSGAVAGPTISGADNGL